MERFEILNELEVLDTKTDLVWRRDFVERVDWLRAQEYAALLGDGWRLPTKKELQGLINKGRRNPASDFPDMPSWCFWTSLWYSGFANSAWSVNFVDGTVNHEDIKTSDYNARCVCG